MSRPLKWASLWPAEGTTSGLNQGYSDGTQQVFITAMGGTIARANPSAQFAGQTTLPCCSFGEPWVAGMALVANTWVLTWKSINVAVCNQTNLRRFGGTIKHICFT